MTVLDTLEALRAALLDGRPDDVDLAGVGDRELLDDGDGRVEAVILDLEESVDVETVTGRYGPTRELASMAGRRPRLLLVDTVPKVGVGVTVLVEADDSGRVTRAILRLDDVD